MSKNSGQCQSQYVFFEQITQEHMKQFQGFYSENVSLKSKKKISILDEYLVISEKLIDDYRPIMFKKLDQNLRFRKTRSPNLFKVKTPFCYGLTLINNKGQSLDIYFQYELVLDILQKRLSELIMRVGFFEDYKIIEKIGKGSTSVVYKIRRVKDGKIFSGKAVLKSYLEAKPKRKQSLFNQILILRVLDHENILKIEQVYDEQTHIFVITEFLNGGNLIERVNSRKEMSLKHIKIIINSIIQGLKYMHKIKIMHRDIKLENVMFRNQDSWEVVIVDFGLAEVSDNQSYTIYRCGTPGYIPPEIILMKKQKEIDVKCDIFSAGVILHILLTKRYLFQASQSSQIYRKNYEFNFDLNAPLYEDLDPEGIHLLQEMLELDVYYRISAQQILNHPFTSTQEQSQQKSDVKTPSFITQYECIRL